MRDGDVENMCSEIRCARVCVCTCAILNRQTLTRTARADALGIMAPNKLYNVPTRVRATVASDANLYDIVECVCVPVRMCDSSWRIHDEDINNQLEKALNFASQYK